MFSYEPTHERGTEVALFDYADYAERLYKVRSLLLLPNILSVTQGVGWKKFSERFNITLYRAFDDRSMIDKYMSMGCNFLYIIKDGSLTSHPRVLSPAPYRCPPLCIGIHAVFRYEPHGNTYAAISQGIIEKDRVPVDKRAVVPHIVSPVNLTQYQSVSSWRQSLNISQQALVLCRHGAKDTFNIRFVYTIIINLLKSYDDQQLHFVFLNTDPFPLQNTRLADVARANYKAATKQMIQAQHRAFKEGKQYSPHRQLHFYPVITDAEKKDHFFRTCDAMLHARDAGETFGLAIAEFSVRNLPVITFSPSPSKLTAAQTKSNEHLRILGERGFYYKDANDLMQIIRNMMEMKQSSGYAVLQQRDYNAYRDFEPEKVMKLFVHHFLEPIYGKEITAKLAFVN